MLDYLQPEELLFLDIETVPEHPTFQNLPAELQPLFLKKTERLRNNNESDDEHYFNHAGIYAEFGKVVCISMAYLKKNNDTYQLLLKSLAADDERVVLENFLHIITQEKFSKMKFCGHNIREFDIPFLCRRLLIQNMSVPENLDFSGKKPWEVPLIDTLQLWSFGDKKHYTSLKLLALLLGIDSPKEEMDGKDVGRVYWIEKNLPRIVEYCEKDVITVAQLVLRFKRIPLLLPEHIRRSP
ncbi:MAG: ribonuclease H-like domain-containing protein [Chitinophagales bacterium]|nr:ribonuclease H-like domain-containing protein [Chitinophagales bacterium]MDW8427012.1 ribonuclease H-like domain-containing protein [Chitinophagales bacterium]